MQLKDLARRLPDDIWVIFEPLLPAKVWVGNGRPPATNRECLHVLATGISWDMRPWCFPSYKTVQRRLQEWLRKDAFLTGWKQLAERCHNFFAQFGRVGRRLDRNARYYPRVVPTGRLRHPYPT
ncbi:transposase [Gemmata sp. JC673]|uniref:Transposase n=1 Tax=Gemmata algarum TaxID=2975278 RepID=A0ABU5ETR6_9BACT|nr:transposase [Gemmata algarum]MDY3558364.1 transposase [Gemmata algarum]